MWNDGQNAADHHADLIRVRARIVNENLQGNTPGQITSSKEAREYRLKVIDTMISQSSTEMSVNPIAKQGEVYH
jgi:hypothetical protein